MPEVTTPNIRELRRQRATRDEGTPFVVRLLVVLGVVYLLYVLAGFFIAPRILKGQLETRATQQLKREVTVGRVAFNPLTLSLTLEKLIVNDPDRKPLLGWSSLYVNFELWALVSRQLHFAEINLNGFAGRLHVSKDGVLNVADLVPPSGADEPAGEPWALRVDRLAVNRAELDYTDESRAQPFSTHLGPTTFVLRDFRTSGQTGAPGVFTALSEAGEDIEWTGRVALAPLRSSGELRIRKLAVKKYAPFYSQAVGFDVLDGTVDVQVPYEFFLQDDRPQLRLTEATVKVDLLKLAPRGSTEPAVEATLIEVGPASFDLLASTADISKVLLSGGRIVTRRTAEGINLATFAPPSAKNAATTAPATAAAPRFQVRVGELGVKGVTLRVEDATTPRTAEFEVQQVAVSIKQFSLAELSKPLPVEVRGEFSPGGGTLRVNGTVAAQPLAGTLAFAVEGLSLPALSPWVESAVQGRVRSGVSNLKGNATLRTASGGEVALAATADADVTLLELTDVADQRVMAWKSLTVSGIDYNSAPARLTIAELTLSDPEVTVVRAADGAVNLAGLVRSSGAPKETPASARSPVSTGEPAGMFMALDRIALANGRISFSDRSVSPEVKTGIDRLAGTITGLSSVDIDRADVAFNGQINGTAPLALTGKINVLARERAIDLRVEVRNSDLRPLSPYVGKYVGYQLDQGVLTLDTTAKVSGRRLDSTTQFVLSDFNLGAATESPDAPKVPVNFALALLRDREGKIALTIPVQGSLEDPSFAFGAVFGKVISNLITRAATAPFSLLGAMFGGGRAGEELSFLTFEPGAVDLDPQDAVKLEVLSRALRERPALRLAISGGYDPKADLALLRERELDRRIRTTIWEQARQVNPGLTLEELTVSREGEARVIAEFYREAFVKPHEQVIGADAAAPAADEAAEPERARRRFFLFRWFTRDRPEPTPTPTPTVVLRTPTQSGATAARLPIEAEMRSRLLEIIPVADADLAGLARKRAQRVLEAVVAQSQAPDRVQLAEAPTTGGARVDFQLR